MRFYIGDKVLPKQYRKKENGIYGIIIKLNYDHIEDKPKNDSEIKYAISWLSMETKDFPTNTKLPKSAWWCRSGLKQYKEEAN